MKRSGQKLLSACALTLSVTACASSQPQMTIPTPSISIVGDYLDNYNISQVIGNKMWITAGTSYFTYVQVNNPQAYLTAQNASANPYYPNKFSRFEWTSYQGSLWYCQQVYDANSPIEANNFNLYPKANSSNPSTGGCGTGENNFPWSQLIAQ